MWRVLACAVYCVSISAQSPADTKKPLVEATAAESGAYALAARVAVAFRERLGPRFVARAMQQEVGVFDHYELIGVVLSQGDPIGRAMNRDGLERVLKFDPELLYLIPRKSGAAARKMFCVREDGVVAYTDNTLARSADGEQPFDLISVLGAGGRRDLRAFPRTPARGRDGNLWMPASMLPAKRLRVVVVDDAREPMSMEDVVCAPAAEPFVVKHPLAAGVFRTKVEGDAEWHGLPAQGLGFALLRRPKVWIDPADVDVRGDSVRITVSRDLLLRARIQAHEMAAIATLLNISSAQSQCQASGVIDGDQNGMGEYGTFAELSGAQNVRDSKNKIVPPVLSAAFGKVRDGIVERSGYRFRMFLPNAEGLAVGEAKDGGAGEGVAADQSELLWCCYAWPVQVGRTGNRTFLITQRGDVLATSTSYSGDDAPPPHAGFVNDRGMAQPVAGNRQGADGREWRVVR